MTLCNDIHVLANTEEKLTCSNDLDVMAIELNSLLNELNCPYECLMTGDPSTRFHNEKNAMRLLDYLIVELMALQMHHSNNKAVGTGNVIELVSNQSSSIELSFDLPIAARNANCSSSQGFMWCPDYGRPAEQRHFFRPV